jgi:branched-chain amino acid transport system permease protein
MNATIIAVAYAVMALGLNIVVGFAGLLDLGYVAFYALGAYSLGWFGSGFFFQARVHVLVSPAQSKLAGVHLNFILILAAAALICALAGTLIGLPTLRLRGDYIAIVTLAFGEIIGVVAVNGQSIPVGGGMTLTAGNLGISAVDQPYFPGIGQFNLLDLRPWYWLILAILLFVLLHRRQRRPVPVRVLDLHPRDGDHRRPGLDLGGRRGRDGARLHQQLPDPGHPQ